MNSEKRSQINMSITAFLKDALYNYDLPGLSVGIQSKDDEAIILSFGYSNYEKKTPLTKEHIFHMASITKLFTGSSVLKLANEGIVSLDAPLVSLMPYFSMKENKNLDFSYKTITPRQILSHTSGLPDVTNYHWELKEHEKNSL